MFSASFLNVLAFTSIALVAGALVPFQAASNAFLGRSLSHPLWATVASLIVSMLVILPLIYLSRIPTPRVTDALHLPYWSWLGGIAGATFITAALFLTPRMGSTSFTVCVITGQMLAAALIDHFGLMGLTKKEVNTDRLIGIFLILSGVFVVQRFTPTPSS